MPTKTVRLSGASDDTIVIDDGPEELETDAYNQDVTFHVRTSRERIAVRLYIEDLSGCWHVSVGQVDETAPLPAWPVKITQSKDRDYAVVVELTVPAEAELIEVGA